MNKEDRKVVLVLAIGAVVAIIAFFALTRMLFAAPVIVELSPDDKLSGYFPFDSDAVDYSGNVLNSTLSGGTFVDGMVDGALEFDGNDYVDVEDSDLLDLGGKFTIMGWVKLDKLTSEINGQDSQSILSKDIEGDDFVGSYSLKISQDDRFVFEFQKSEDGWGDAQWIRSNILTKEDWYHIAITYMGPDRELKVFVNGELENSKVLDDSFWSYNSDYNLIIGGVKQDDGSFKDKFNGKLDDFRIYKRVLGPGEIITKYNNVIRDEQLHYSFDGDLGDDSSENNYDGEMVGSPKSVAGVLGKAIELGGNQYIKSSNNLLDLEKDFTIGVWVKTEDSARMGILEKYDGESGYGLYLDPSGRPRFFSKCDTFTDTNSGSSVADGSWHYIVAVRDGSANKRKIYIDGILKKEESDTQCDDFWNQEKFYIGSNYTGDAEYFQGALDEIIVYSSALSGNEIESNYENTYLFYNGMNLADGTGADSVVGMQWNALKFKHDENDILSTDEDLDFGQVTASAWIRLDDSNIGITRTILSDGNPWNPSFRMHIDKGGYIGMLYIGEDGETMKVSSEGLNSEINGIDPLLTERWYHVVGVIDKTYMKIYLDGTLVARRNHNGNLPKLINNKLSIGNVKPANGNKNGFNGNIDEVKIWGRALSDSEIGVEYGKKLWAYYKFDGNAVDSGPYHHHDGFVHGASKEDGIKGDSLVFDGENDYVDTTRKQIFGEEFGTYVWVWLDANVTNKSIDRVIMSKSITGEEFSSYELYIDEDNKANFIFYDKNATDFYNVSSSVGLSDEEWHMLGVSLDRNILKLYVDGVLDGALDTKGKSPMQSDDKTFLGMRVKNAIKSGYFKGRMDEMEVSGSAFTSSEMANLFNSLVDEDNEIDNNSSGTCTPSWTCTYGSCIDDLKTMSCTDLNYCGSNDIPAEDGTTASCQTPNYNNTSTGGTNLTGEGEKNLLGSAGMWIIWIGLLVGIIVIVFVIFLKMRVGNKSGRRSSTSHPQSIGAGTSGSSVKVNSSGSGRGY